MVTVATVMTIVRRNGPGDIGRDDREHNGRAHQANSRTHTHNMYTPLFARSFACLLARGRARARGSTRRTKKKRKEETPRKRDPRRHQALRASSLSASSCTTRTYPRIPLGETRRKTSGKSALSLVRIVSLRVALASARAPRTPTDPFAVHPYRSLLLSFANLRQPPPVPLSASSASRSPSASLSRLSIHSGYFSPSRGARSLSSLPLRNPTDPFYQEFSSAFSLSLSLSPLSPREEICRADSFSSRKSCHLCPRSRAL